MCMYFQVGCILWSGAFSGVSLLGVPGCTMPWKCAPTSCGVKKVLASTVFPPSIITSRHSALFEFGYYVIVWPRTYVLALACRWRAGTGQPAVNQCNNASTTTRTVLAAATGQKRSAKLKDLRGHLRK